jgi:uncharacterized protein
MKTARKTLFAFTLLLSVTNVFAQQYPQPTGYVNDFASLLSQEQGALLNNELAEFEEKTTIEIAVVTVSRLNNQSIENYTRGLATEWGVGKRGQNNGVVFLVAPKEREMRIQTASGVRMVLTDRLADNIRDNVILPRFKSGNMAQGIVDGTHAIMRVLDANSTPSTSTVEPQIKREWTSEDTKAFWIILGIIICAILCIVIVTTLVVPPIRRNKAHRYVLENKGAISTRFAEADRTARNSDVKDGTRKKFTNLKSKFNSIDRLTTTSEGVEWIKVCEELDSMSYQLGQIVSEMDQEIAFAEKARREGPELMKSLPGMIDDAEKKLADGNQSQEATKYLQEARAQYARAQAQQSGMTTVDWIILYAILANVRSNAESAVYVHNHINRPKQSSSISRRSSSSSYGFGKSGGFGGGGGFGRGGGGSTGRW